MPENKFKGIFANPTTKIIDRALYYADILGAPSHVMNAARDLVNQSNNVPVKAATAVQTRIPVTAYRNKLGGKLNYFNFFLNNIC